MSTKDSIDEIDALMANAKNTNVSLEKIMDKFIVADKNLILKTDIENCKNFTILKTIESELRSKGLKKSARTIHIFLDWYIKARVSNNRLSRKEILDAISAVKRENSTSTIGAKLLGLATGEKKENV
jgi:hypothetical protein